jgi:GT2 family glycosyltransferase
MQRPLTTPLTEHAPLPSSVSVIIVSYEVCARLRRCLESLESATDIVVVDNASTDGSAAMVRESFPDVTLVANTENLGFGAAVNQALPHCSGDMILLLNPDAHLQSSLAMLSERLARLPLAAGIGFRQVDESGFFQLSFGPPPWLFAELVRHLVQRSLDRRNAWVAARLDRIFSRPMRVPWVSASSLLLRSRALRGAGGFDERFFLFFEDIDLCLRLRQLGSEIWYDPTLTVIHERGSSAAVQRATAASAYRDSHLYFWRKHRGPWVGGAVRAYARIRQWLK